VRFVQPSAAKLNLSLRVTKKRGDGYHDIVSVFLRLPPLETLLISARAEGDEVRVYGVDIGKEGKDKENGNENIVARGLMYAREAGYEIPFLDVEILKTLYPGSGLGAGSGNGAAILRWLAGGNGFAKEHRDDLSCLAWRDVALKMGADVPFLFSEIPLALVSGIGEVIEPLEPLNLKPRLHALIVFPSWSVGTGNAYSQLDRRCGSVYPLDETAARTEAENLCRKLRSGERVGLLPNDFTPGLLEEFPDYGKLFDVFEKKGSCAWGITGSGGAAFALSSEASSPLAFQWPLEMRQVLSVVVS
jgi:4-diphosphocytidyl-2-C-methyl-D-erythritol kinase